MCDTFPFQNFPGRHQEDFAIQPKRAMIDIPEIKKKPLVPVGVIPTIYLSPPSQTGWNLMTTVLFRIVLFQIFHEKRPRTNEAHLAFHDVEQFRKFVQAGAAHQLTESCESIRIGQEMPVGATGIGHCPELIQHKGLSV